LTLGGRVGLTTTLCIDKLSGSTSEGATTMGQTDGAGRPDVGSTEPGTPRWVKVSWVIAAVIVVVVLTALLIGGDHGPSMHGAP
jgi:hypothetical protein